MHDSIAEVEEKDLVKRLLAAQHWRQRLIGLHGIPSDVIPYPEVPLTGLADLEGDIDLLLVPAGRPDLSVAIQVKCVKVVGAAFATESPNKLNKLRQLPHQANPLAHSGFSQVYCFVLVAVDSRANNAGTVSYEGLTPALRTKIDAKVTLEKLDARVGLVHFELVQPIDDRPLGAGTYFIRPKRMALSVSQPARITEWVQSVVQGRSA